MRTNYLFTSESVSEGHPDKMADQISDAILDAYLTEDPESKVACETLVTHEGVIVAGEIHSKAKLHDSIDSIVRGVVEDIGYSCDVYGSDLEEMKITNYLHEQSPEIRKGVLEGGAGDQGLMFGYACDETKELMPLAIWLSHRIMERQAQMRKSHSIPWLLPDAKSQVTINYRDGVPDSIDTIIVSTQHMPYILSAHDEGGFGGASGMRPHGHYNHAYRITNQMIYDNVVQHIIKPVIPEYLKSDDIKYLINPSGRFEIGGPAADTGLTGRKIIVDTYGGSCPHGGGAFSGKDPSKVDRSAAYMARYIAKNIVASGVTKKCVVQLAYAIGKAEPVSFMLDFQGTGTVPEIEMEQFIKNNLDLTPRGIIEKLNLKRPIYLKTAAYGHFGRELPEFTWEVTDLANKNPFI
ncbi:MAG: methionine adenosyltransferase [Bacteroidota bacterium]